MEHSFVAFSLLTSLTLFSVTINWSCGFAVRGADLQGEKSRSSEIDRCETHFKLKLMSSDGEWESYVHYAAEDGTAVLPDSNCEKVTWFQQEDKPRSARIQIQRPMTVGSDKAVLVGHQNGEYKDFYGVLIVTMTQKPNDTSLPLYKKVIGNSVESYQLAEKRATLSLPPPKMCVFYIGARGPGFPVLYAYGFQNANCVLKNPISGPSTVTFILTAK